jgi:putative drug exporter of the RND superfamily
VSVLASITLLPAMLSLLGPKINRGRVMPKRFVEPHPPDDGFWGRWSQLVLRRPLLVFVVGAVIVSVVVAPAFHINPSNAQIKDEPAAGDAELGRNAITAAGIPDGIYLPYVVLVEKAATPEALAHTVAILDETHGIWGSAAPPSWRKGDVGLVEAFGTDDGSSRAARTTMSTLKSAFLPRIRGDLAGGGKAPDLTLGGFAPESRDFVSAVYGKFPFVLLFVLILTYVLLARAFRSLVLPLKAVLLNLVSLGAAYGIIVFIFQDGHGSKAIWGLDATNAIISWIPLMIFAFLFGISMDYEVFMLTRIREEYDATGDTAQSIAHGLARTGKLVTSASLVLMFAFFTLSTGPGPDIKQFAIGLAAGIVFDATVIRALLVPATMQLLGRWNWWLPAPIARVLRVAASEA